MRCRWINAVIAVTARVGHQRHATGVAHQRRLRHGVVRVPSQDHIKATHPAGELQVHVHAVVRQQCHQLCTFRTRGIDNLLQRQFADAKGPVGREVTRMRNGRVRKRLADDGHCYAIDGAQRVRCEHRVAKVHGRDVLRHEIDAVPEVVVDHVLHARGTIGEFPVPGHHVHAKQLLRFHHVLALRPQRGGRALPRVTAIQQQRTWARCPQLLHQRCQVREATQLAVCTRSLDVVEVGERMCGGTA
jgi:hypothetical protein